MNQARCKARCGRFCGDHRKAAFHFAKAPFKNAKCVAPKAGKTNGSSLEGRRIPSKHIAILECLSGRGMRPPGHQRKFGNYFARNSQSKDSFLAVFTEL